MKTCPLQGKYLFKQSQVAALLSPGPGVGCHWPWPNTPETNNEYFTKILKLGGMCGVLELQGCGPLATGQGDPATAYCVQIKIGLLYSSIRPMIKSTVPAIIFWTVKHFSSSFDSIIQRFGFEIKQ